MILRVTQYGEAVLQKKGKKIERFDAALERLAANMQETMYAKEGVGLAAQQVGKRLQLCVIDLNLRGPEIDFSYTFDGRQPPLELLLPLTLVNPHLEPFPHLEVIYEEGCLSFPGIRAEISRPKSIRADFQDLQGAQHTLICDGHLARVIIHEVDHLNGILFIDQMEPDALKAIEPDLKKLKRRTRRWLKAQKIKTGV